MTHAEEQRIARKLTQEALSHLDRALDKLDKVAVSYYGTGEMFNAIMKDYLTLNALYGKIAKSEWAKHK